MPPVGPMIRSPVTLPSPLPVFRLYRAKAITSHFFPTSKIYFLSRSKAADLMVTGEREAVLARTIGGCVANGRLMEGFLIASVRGIIAELSRGEGGLSSRLRARHVCDSIRAGWSRARHSRVALVARGSSLSLTQFKPHPP